MIAEADHSQRSLALTELSRSWAQLWVAHHGRRFACYKQRADTGQKRKQVNGSDASVSCGIKAATNSLSAKKRPSSDMTVLGIPRKDVVRTFDPSKPKSKLLQGFEKISKTKTTRGMAQNQMLQTAQGRKSLWQLTQANKTTGRVFGCSRNTTPNFQTVIDMTGCSSPNLPPGLCYLRVQSLSSVISRMGVQALVLMRQSGPSLLKALSTQLHPKTEDLKAAICLIAFGGQVATSVTSDSNKRFLFKVGMLNEQRIHMSSDFESKHRGYAALLKACALAAQSRWKICSQAERQSQQPSKACSEIKDVESLCRFLRCAARVATPSKDAVGTLRLLPH
jgi:hypothetical protein